MPSTLRTLRHAPILAVLLAASFGAHAQATTYKMRIPVGPIAAAAPDISIPGYDPVAGTFQSAQGSFTWSGTAYGVTTGTAFGHTGPVTLMPAVTANAVRAAMRDNPGSLAGTLAEGWLTAQGFSWNGTTTQWEKAPGGYTVGVHGQGNGCDDIGPGASVYVPTGSGLYHHYIRWPFIPAGCIAGPPGDPYQGINNCPNANACGSYEHIYAAWSVSLPGSVAPDQADWDALPDPLPTVAPELPYAPYLPGVAVQNNFQILDLNTNTTHNCTNGGCD